MTSKINSWPVLNLAEFLAIVAVSTVFGAAAFYRVLGIVGAVHALLGALSQNIPVGIEGRAPSFILRGRTAVVVGIVIAIACGALTWFAPLIACVLSEGGECAR